MHLEARLSHLGFLSFPKGSGENQSDIRTCYISASCKRNTLMSVPEVCVCRFTRSIFCLRKGRTADFISITQHWNVSKNIQYAMNSVVYMLLLIFQRSFRTGFIKETSDIFGNTGVDEIRKDTYFLPDTSASTITSLHSRSAPYHLFLGLPFNLQTSPPPPLLYNF
jgi:hypothetical protein